MNRSAGRNGHSLSSLSHAQLGVIAAMVGDRIADRLSVREMASAIGMSASCFARLFKATTGQTPHAFLLEQRVRRAARVIADGRVHSLSQVAMQCGFADQAHLTRVFRRLMGTTPADYCRTLRT